MENKKIKNKKVLKRKEFDYCTYYNKIARKFYIFKEILNINLSPQYDFFGRNAGLPIYSLDLCEVCKPLVESVFLDLADIKKKEKGIDVWIAVDIMRKLIIENKFDVCVLISGDADFVPALNLIKERGKEILTSMVALGYSSELRKKFPYFILRKETLMKCLRNYKDVKKKRE